MGSGGGNLLHSPQAIAVDGMGNVYVAGAQTDNAFEIDLFIFADGFESGDTSAWSSTAR